RLSQWWLHHAFLSNEVHRSLQRVESTEMNCVLRSQGQIVGRKFPANASRSPCCRYLPCDRYCHHGKGKIMLPDIRRHWPLVALPADKVRGVMNSNIVWDFAATLSAGPRPYFVRDGGDDLVVFCFSHPPYGH